MGEVYLAKHFGLGKEVALKTPRRELLGDQVMMKRFVQEAMTAAKIEHPHICTITMLAESTEYPSS